MGIAELKREMGMDAPERNEGERGQTSWRGRASIPAAVPATRVPRLANPEVSDKAVPRRFTAEYKRRILQEADQCGSGGITALMRSGFWQGAARSIACTFLARIIHEASTAAADPGMSTALRLVGFLDVLSSTPAESSRRAPCSHARLRRLATNLHE
ncbi:MAG: hypothetical protein H6Q05_3772 [Acidobacteria bacterium]|jgi:hypothetical protein|nr:hypothetical protein [Acidobacteriota bacterium]